MRTAFGMGRRCCRVVMTRPEPCARDGPGPPSADGSCGGSRRGDSPSSRGSISDAGAGASPSPSGAAVSANIIMFGEWAVEQMHLAFYAGLGFRYRFPTGV